MIRDLSNLYTINANLLYEIAQFRVQLNNRLISDNENTVKNLGLDNDIFSDFNAQVLEEINSYKVYECWSFFNNNSHDFHTSLLR